MWYLGIQGLVDPLHDPGEHALVEGLGEGSDGVDDLLHVAALLHVLCTHTDPWLDQGLDQLHRVDAQEMRHLLSIYSTYTIKLCIEMVGCFPDSRIVTEQLHNEEGTVQFDLSIIHMTLCFLMVSIQWHMLSTFRRCLANTVR
jgi:hypothetical protein